MKYFQFNVCAAHAKHQLRRFVFFLREYFFPAGCALCGSSLLDMDETWYGLCADCHAELLDDSAWMLFADGCAKPSNGTPAEQRCERCGKPMVSGKGTCLACREGPHRSYDRLVTVFCYSGKYRQLFGAYKFSKNLSLGHFFAELIVRAYRLLECTGSQSPGFIVPVPPSPGKIRKAGWDQVEYLARLLEAGWGELGGPRRSAIPVYRCLKRLPSKTQKKLSRSDRMENLKGRIILTKPAPLTAVILDDVITTGSTMEACAVVLKAGGCQNVYGICVVYD